MKTTMKIRMMAAGAACLCAALSASATEWTYSASGTTYTISDGQWTLKVGKLTATNTTLKVTDISAWSDPTSDPDKKKGVLDLRKPLTVTVDDATATITSVEVGKSALAEYASVVEIYCDIIGAMDAGGSCFASNANMTNIVIGGTAETLPGLVLNRCPKLKTVKLNFPDLRMVGDRPFGTETHPDLVDVSTYAPPGVTNVYNYATQDYPTTTILYGDLVLTNIMTMGSVAFGGANLENVFLSGTLNKLEDYTFAGRGTITNVVFDLPNLESISSQAFGIDAYGAQAQQTNIHSAEILSAIPDMSQITNIVRYAGNTDTTTGTAASTGCRVYISKRQWTKEAREEATYSADENPTGYFAGMGTFTDDEKAKIAADPTLARAYGVLVVGGVRKAFVVNKASPHDKIPGLIIIIQ